MTHLLAGKDDFGGTLKIAMPSDLGRNLMLGWLDEFEARHPRCYQLSVSDRVADMVRQQVDVAIRYGQQDDSSMIALPIAPANDRVLVASRLPARARSLLALEDLRNIIACASRWKTACTTAGPSTACPARAGDGVRERQPQRGRRRPRAALGRGRAGHRLQIAAGPVRRPGRWPPAVLPQVAGEAAPLHLVCMHRAQVTPLVLQLRDFLRDKCVALP
jgi:DNA-binding transcriptional LysR family regulator